MMAIRLEQEKHQKHSTSWRYPTDGACCGEHPALAVETSAGQYCPVHPSLQQAVPAEQMLRARNSANNAWT